MAPRAMADREYVVVDASLAVKWVLTEDDSPQALALLNEWQEANRQPIAPSWIACEVANVIYQYIAPNTFAPDQAGALVDEVLAQVAIQSEAPEDARRAIQIAHAAGQHQTYDAQYAALAERLGCELWTADMKFVNATRGRLPHVRPLSEWQPA